MSAGDITYQAMTGADTAVRHRKVVRRVNPMRYHHKESIFSFSFFLFFLYLYEKMVVS